jgi:hypothetical protein
MVGVAASSWRRERAPGGARVLEAGGGEEEPVAGRCRRRLSTVPATRDESIKRRGVGFWLYLLA